MTLRSRLLLGIGAVLLPYILASAVALYYVLPSMLNPLKNVVHEVVYELDPVRHLEITLNKAAMPVHDYLITGSKEEREAFGTLRDRIDRDLSKIEGIEHNHPMEMNEIVYAREEWKAAVPIADRILALDDPVGFPDGTDAMREFDQRIDAAVDHLERFHDLAHQQIRNQMETAQNAHAGGLWLVFSALAAALAVSGFAATALARSMLSGVSELRTGAARLAQGELDYRIRPDRKDEFGELGRAFDLMAEKVQRAQATLKSLADHDTLTGLINRRELSRRLEEEFVRSRRYEYSCALMLLDLDHFKRVNDAWGHPAGDETLQAFALILRNEVRPSDNVARVGGEEFAVMLPQTDRDGAGRLAERVRRAICGIAITHIEGHAVELTVSVGIAVFPENGETERALNAAADRGLYAAKRAGRNQVCFSDGTAVDRERETDDAL